MSGQPVRKPGDVNKYYNDYMEALNLTASLDDMNLQANKNFLLNGILPAVSQMKDNRTTTEMLADIEKLKSKVATIIARISNMQFGTGVVSALLASPLNIDNKLIIFMAQRGDDLIEQIKRNYGVGIRGDINDIDVMVKHIEDFFNKTYNTIKSVKGYIAENSRSIVDSRYELINGTNINQITRDVENITISLMSRFGKANDTDWDIENARTMQPLFQRLSNLVVAIRAFARYGLPSNQLIEQTRDNLLHALDRRVDTRAAGDVPHAVRREQILAAQDVTDTLEQYNEYLSMLEALPKPSVNSIYTLLTMMEHKIKTKSIKGLGDTITSLENLFAFVFERNMTPPLAVRRAFEEAFGEREPREAPPGAPVHGAPRAFRADVAPGAPIAIVHPDRHGHVHPIHPFAAAPQLDEPHVDGEGLIRKKRSNFRGFGLAEINHKKLDMGVLSIRRPSKGNYKSVPQQRISTTLQHIVRDIEGGKLPNFNDINSLSCDEKDYLHKVVSASGFDNKLSIPSPNKDVIEKDIHSFEVLKGEILAGNDSKALIKKFKILILKLSNKGTLPKKEANDVLYTLLSLGY